MEGLNVDILKLILKKIIHRDIMIVCKSWNDLMSRAIREDKIIPPKFDTAPTVVFANMNVQDKLCLCHVHYIDNAGHQLPLSKLKPIYRISWDIMINNYTNYRLDLTLRTLFTYFKTAFMRYEEFRYYIHTSISKLDNFWYKLSGNHSVRRRVKKMIKEIWKYISNADLMDRIQKHYYILVPAARDDTSSDCPTK